MSFDKSTVYWNTFSSLKFPLNIDTCLISCFYMKIFLFLAKCNGEYGYTINVVIVQAIAKYLPHLRNPEFKLSNTFS